MCSKFKQKRSVLIEKKEKKKEREKRKQEFELISFLSKDRQDLKKSKWKRDGKDDRKEIVQND